MFMLNFMRFIKINFFKNVKGRVKKYSKELVRFFKVKIIKIKMINMFIGMMYCKVLNVFFKYWFLLLNL